MVAPGPPSNIKVDVISSYELNVSWDLPAEANGVITRYEVTIYEKEKENVNETHDAKLEKSKLFIGLEPFTSYMVEVQASTKAGRGNWFIQCALKLSLLSSLMATNDHFTTYN